MKTLAEALQLAAQIEDTQARRVYACDETFEEPLTVTAGVTLYGGLDCDAHWQWGEAKKTTLTAPPGVVPLTMRAEGETVRLEDLHVIAPSIAAMADAGTSAIAAIAERCAVDVVRCTFEAGDAAPGARAAAPPQPARPPQGNAGNPACSATIVSTVSPLPETCGTADPSDDSSGGRGGHGFQDRGTYGITGSPGAEDNPNGGEYLVAGGTCTQGGPGRAGDSGAPGPGALGIGQLSSAGYTGSPGRDGQHGKTAQGGGGGGSTRGNSECPGTTEQGGASGGNGGAGGCGGAGGRGGSPGGSSIALVSVNATLTFRDGVQLIARDGGRGGDGAAGQDGGPGAHGGPGGRGSPDAFVANGCDGGQGGQGGSGGRGGGGQGGHSLGLAFLGTPDTIPSLEGVTVQLGLPGTGGAGSDDQNRGDAGKASGILDFSPPQRAPAP
ncbi:hypothetical protein [Sorangium sp. So ce887]|uniref:hypothetical protein n=1 Tax=Sorangium sp. So ce887 TaxID=3133324 RepID=UPI003F5E4FD5